jgi:hypothetical protein
MSADGIYQIALIGLLGIGGVKLITDLRSGEEVTKPRPKELIILAALGILCATIALEMPLKLRSNRRFTVAFAVFMTFIIAYGLAPYLRNQSLRRASPAILLLVLFVSAGPVLAFDIQYENQDIPAKQNSFSASEYYGVSSASEFVTKYDADPVAAPMNIRHMLALFGIYNARATTITESGMNYPNTLVYNSNWNRYTVRLSHTESSHIARARMSEEWLQNHIDESNKIHDSGDIGVVKNSSV